MNTGGLLHNLYQARNLEHYNLTFIEINPNLSKKFV